MSLKNHNILGDHRGKLVAIEALSDIPFDIKRVFYIYGTQPDVPRGQHSHYQTKQYLIAVNGSCKVTLDDGVQVSTYDLNQPNIGLLQDSLIWGMMHDFSEDCVLMVLASEHYDESDYIRDYSEFLECLNVSRS
ncbi:sugar 3,4-ketoisomerase [Vibrio metschnikovii]|uniref:sugar 3,4-ketoisomerase n=1 Tax=Vibrio metschnikovii TaxID=28172 RepID=UPI00130240B0|nr:FdtA/QdtA family cupin domain-containing protein [Vibrio metschnikovii]